jgi:hypothetical protein
MNRIELKAYKEGRHNADAVNIPQATQRNATERRNNDQKISNYLSQANKNSSLTCSSLKTQSS